MENLYHKIERYVLGELTGQELLEFETALQSDAALATSVAQHREMIARLDALRLRNKVKAAIQPSRVESAGLYPRRTYWALAASILLLAAAIWFMNPPGEKKSTVVDTPSPPIPTETPATAPIENPAPKSEQQTPSTTEKPKPSLIALAHEFHEQPAQSFLRDASPQEDEPSAKTPFQLAAAAYKDQNYPLVLAQLRKQSINEQDEEAMLLRAHAQFELGQFVGAARDFKALERSFQFKHEARWNYLLCQMALGKTAQAKTLLAEMVADKDFLFHAKALRLEEKIIQKGF